MEIVMLPAMQFALRKCMPCTANKRHGRVLPQSTAPEDRHAASKESFL